MLPTGPRCAIHWSTAWQDGRDTFEKVFGLRTAGDLLRHYPRRYYTRGELTPLDSLHEGDHVTVLAMVELVSRPGSRPTISTTTPR